MTTNSLSSVNKRISLSLMSLLASAGLLASTTSIALAATAAKPIAKDPAPVSDNILIGDSGNKLFNNYLIPFTNFLAAAVGIIVVISIIIGAIEYSSAGGDPNKAAKARGRISKAIVSLIVFFFLYAILQWIVPGGIGG